jgi:hypothetical protein
LSPCKCNENRISCGGNEWYNLKHVFQTIDQKLEKNEKKFKQFNLTNTEISEIEANTFFGITFDEINIFNATNLKLINTHAFTSTNLVTQKFFVNEDGCFDQSFTGKIPLINSPPNFNLFEMLSSMINLEAIVLCHTELKEIPNHAFRSIIGNQYNLSKIIFSGDSIAKIDRNPFSDLDSLEHISLYKTKIESIPTNAFYLKNNYNKKLKIDLRYSVLNGSSFEIGSFSHLKRPTEIDLSFCSNMTYLEEKIFQPFFEINNENGVKLSNEYFDCNDCRSSWLKTATKYKDRTGLSTCSNGKKFTDSSNFAKC